jgi:hypothetical protein
MRLALAALCLVICTTSVTAQTHSEDNKPGDSPYSTGRSVLPDTKGQLQPQGWTGPLSTGTGGAPAASPQGDTPPDMQPAPGGASKTIVDPSPAERPNADAHGPRCTTAMYLARSSMSSVNFTS